MAVFQSQDHLYDVMNDVFVKVSTDSENIDSFLRSNLVIRVRFTGPEGEMLIDGRQPPLRQ